MTTFREACVERKIGALAVFGDSITSGAGASQPRLSWAARLAAALATRLVNRGVDGTVLQSTPIQDGRGENGVSRFRRDLIERDRADAVAILYGYNDARYTAEPERFNVAAFIRDYRVILDGLLPEYARDAIAIGSPPYPSTAGLGRGGSGFTGQTRDGFGRYRDAVRNLATDYGLFYAPVYEWMSERPDGALASEDLTHPNDEGHRVIFAAFAEAQVPVSASDDDAL